MRGCEETPVQAYRVSFAIQRVHCNNNIDNNNDNKNGNTYNTADDENSCNGDNANDDIGNKND